MRWNPEVSAQPAVDNESVKDEQKSHMIVATDACLPLLASGESPIAAHVLINYELPSKKETYTRRMTTCLAGDGIVINMVVGGEVVTLKSLEESSNLVIAEMPIHVDAARRAGAHGVMVGRAAYKKYFDSLKNQNGKVMAGDLPPLMVKLKAFIEMYSEEEIRGILSGLDSDFSDKIDLNPSLRVLSGCANAFAITLYV
ncbi:hypothetical protein FF1_028493 [Malus domestica]